jgi:hypothetical protein
MRVFGAQSQYLVYALHPPSLTRLATFQCLIVTVTFYNKRLRTNERYVNVSEQDDFPEGKIRFLPVCPEQARISLDGVVNQWI